MAKITSFTYCRNVREEGEGQTKNLLIEAPFSQLTFPSFPTYFSFSISFILYDITTNDNTLTIVFKKTSNPEIDLANLKHNLSKEFSGLTIAADFKNVLFDKEGEYFSEVYLDDNNLNKFPIMVNEKGD